MKRLLLSTYLITAIILLACSNDPGVNFNGQYNRPDSSTVEYFDYGGYSDTKNAIIYGKILAHQSTAEGPDTLVPLAFVDIQVLQTGKSVQTDSSGQFEIRVDKGVFSLIVSKKGYEPIVLTNFVSDPDQLSQTRIILAKGTKQRSFFIL